MLGAAEEARLEQRLAEGERATGAQVVMALFASLEGESLEDVSIRLAERWRIGQKGLDNGVILLAFVQDRQLRLEVGYGLEPIITDAESARIISEVIAPRFREGRYAAGLEAAADAIYGRIARPGAPPRRERGVQDGFATAAVLFVIAVIAFMMLGAFTTSRRLNRRRGYTLGPGVGYVPPIATGWGGFGRGGFGRGGGGFGGGGFSGGGGSFGGGGASGRW